MLDRVCVFHTLICPSAAPATSRPSGKAINAETALRHSSVDMHRRLSRSHSLIVWSWLAVSSVRPSGVNASADTGQRCARTVSGLRSFSVRCRRTVPSPAPAARPGPFGANASYHAPPL